MTEEEAKDIIKEIFTKYPNPLYLSSELICCFKDYSDDEYNLLLFVFIGHYLNELLSNLDASATLSTVNFFAQHCFSHENKALLLCFFIENHFDRTVRGLNLNQHIESMNRLAKCFPDYADLFAQGSVEKKFEKLKTAEIKKAAKLLYEHTPLSRASVVSIAGYVANCNFFRGTDGVKSAHDIAENVLSTVEYR